MVYEQLSMFDLMPTCGTTAVCCGFDHEELPASPLDDWMQRIVPDGVYVVYVGVHPLVLRPTKRKENSIPEGHHYYHYAIDGEVYAGVFIGIGADLGEEYEGDE